MTSGDFDYFVVFAEMRTGSNFLEVNINRFNGLTCLGEVFNPHFLAYPSTETLLGHTQAQRDDNPLGLLEAIRDAEGLNGFRFFHDHDPRVLDRVLDDPRCAKIVLTRNPVDSYVSWKIAKQTGQWKLTNATHHKPGQVAFDGDEFRSHVAALQEFQVTLLNRMQKSGQTAFYVAYEDLPDIEVMNGLARFLGSSQEIEALDKKLKKQNPAPMEEKVVNYAEMETSLASLDLFNLNRTPNFEPRRGPNVPSWIAAAKAPVLFQPMRGGPMMAVEAWLADLDGVSPDDLPRRFNQQTMRKWRRQNRGFRSFTVLRHPVARAYRAFCDYILPLDPPAYFEIRNTLRRVYNLPVPAGPLPDTWTAEEQRAAFESFLAFLKANLTGQTAIRVDVIWATQTEILAGFGKFAQPDFVMREDSVVDELAHLCGLTGLTMPRFRPEADRDRVALADIYDADLEAIVADVYQKDYVMFGFGPWTG